jgi:hypothetical protein
MLRHSMEKEAKRRWTKMKKLLCLSVLSLTCLALLSACPALGDYLMVKDVLSTSGGHLESSSYMLDYSTGQVAVGQSAGTEHIESGGFWGWAPFAEEVAVEEEVPEQMPGQYALLQNYPNPFNPETSIGYRLPQAGHVSLMVFNVTGQMVRRLVDWDQAPGEHVATWDGTDQMGQPVASGIYFYQLVTGEFCEVRKMLLLK